jgi:hypothetical protein
MHTPVLPPQTFGYIGQGYISTLRPPSVVTEQALFHAYARTRRPCVCCPPEPEQCACGDWIAPASVADIEAAVAYHNETRRHATWRKLRENCEKTACLAGARAERIKDREANW